jgi:hypothetical protein
VGSLPPDLVVFPPLLLSCVSGISACFQDMLGHTVKTLVQTDLQSVIFTFFTGLPRFPPQKYQSH